MACCEPRGNNPDTPGDDVSIVNVGGGVELYKIGTGPNPFELRTFTSIDNTVIITQNADTIDLFANIVLANEGIGADVYDGATSTPVTKNLRRIRAGANITVTQNPTDITIAATVPATDTCANVGTGAQVYVTGTSVPFNFRTILSADSRLTVTQNANDITLTVNTAVANEGGGVEVYDTVNSTLATKRLRTLTSTGGTVAITQNATTINLEVAASAFESYFSEKTDIVSTNGTAYVVVSTMDAIVGGAIGEVWAFVCTCLICHPSGLSTVNSRLNWQIETSAGVWADLETDLNTNEPQTIAVGQRSSPRSRTYQATLAMATPRLRLRMSMSAAVATGGQTEYAKVSGYRRS
jgi:hypothetical protein